MKAYKLEILVIDHEDLGEKEIITNIENEEYCRPSVMSIKAADIGEWSDDSPLNHKGTQKKEFERLFPEKTLNLCIGDRVFKNGCFIDPMAEGIGEITDIDDAGVWVKWDRSGKTYRYEPQHVIKEHQVISGSFDKYGEIISFEITAEQQARIVQRLLRYYAKHQYIGEGIMQNDDAIIEAPVVLSDICDGIIEFKTNEE